MDVQFYCLMQDVQLKAKSAHKMYKPAHRHIAA